MTIQKGLLTTTCVLSSLRNISIYLKSNPMKTLGSLPRLIKLKFWTEIKPHISKSTPQLITNVRSNGYGLDEWSSTVCLLNKQTITIQKKISLLKIPIKIFEPFPNWPVASYRQICTDAQRCGLTLSPWDLILHLGSVYLNQPFDEVLLLGQDPVSDSVYDNILLSLINDKNGKRVQCIWDNPCSLRVYGDKIVLLFIYCHI